MTQPCSVVPETNPGIMSEKGPNTPVLSKFRVIRNLVVLSVCSMTFFCAFHGLAVLQSTLNMEQGIGMISGALHSGIGCIAAITLPKYLLKKIDYKLLIILSMILIVPYMASNFYPHWILMMPASVLVGLGMPLLWSTECTYLNYLSISYASHLKMPSVIEVEYLDSNAVQDNDPNKETITESAHGDMYLCRDLDNERKIGHVSDDRHLHKNVEDYIQCDYVYGGEIQGANATDPQITVCELYNRDHSDENLLKIDAFGEENNITFTKGVFVVEESWAVLQNVAEYIVADMLKRINNSNNIHHISANDDKYQISCVSKNNSDPSSDSVFLNSNEHISSHIYLQDKSSLQDKTGPNLILEATAAGFFGFHGLFYWTSYIWSNLFSYYVLRSGSVEIEYINNSICMCGADFCNIETDCFEHNLQPPSDEVKNILFSVFVALSLFSVVLIAVFLDKLYEEKENVSFSLDMLMAACKLLKKRDHLLLIPLIISLGYLLGFLIGSFTKAYIGCAWGIHHIGLVNGCTGVFLSSSSLISGWLVKHFGRLSVILTAEALNIAVIIILLLWRPDGNHPVMLFVVGAMMGTVIGVIWTQLRAFLGILFKDDKEAAFGNFSLWFSIGSCLAFAMSNFICISLQIYLFLIVSTTGIIGYIIVERSHLHGNT